MTVTVTGTKTVTIESGPVETVPSRDRSGWIEPQLVKKQQRRLGPVDELMLSWSATGLTCKKEAQLLSLSPGAFRREVRILLLANTAVSAGRLVISVDARNTSRTGPG